ncbi:hypothetical protein [Nitrosopumilus ureiphilus]|uniref:hypothetical protein n=1 Tax=Nitrosopumilus ureiphilus TaxID=1470067 RepID=UPI001FE65E57|nr:hypothetical protein [Nitrosopumilus ureiphilus]
MLISLVSFTASNSVYGLSCGGVNTIQSFAESDVVFAGQVLSKEYVPSERSSSNGKNDAITQFSIIENFKGISQETISIISSEWLWGYNFTKNLEYVVFAYDDGQNLRPQTCTPTSLLEHAEIEQIRQVAYDYIISPLKQFKSGIPIDEIQCKESLTLVARYDGSPVCVNPETKEKLLERGWAILTPKERLYDIETILNNEDCVEFGRWLDEHADGSFNENLLIFDLPVSYEISGRIYDSIPDCISDQSGFFNLNTKHIIDFEKLEKPKALLLPKPNPIEEKYRERYTVEIVGLKDEYKLGEEYSFSFVISGYGHECAGINVSYPGEDGKLQGWGQEPLCDPYLIMHDFEINSTDRHKLFGNITIKNPGTYTVTVIFEQPNKYFPTTASKEFHVVEK